jgi:hypothetical protein
MVMTDIVAPSIFDEFARLRSPDSFTDAERATVAALGPEKREAFDALLHAATIAEKGEAELVSANKELTATYKHLSEIEKSLAVKNPVTFHDCWKAHVKSQHRH